MKRLIVALLVAGVLFVSAWALIAALPLTNQTAGNESNSYSDPWNGMRFFGPP